MKRRTVFLFTVLLISLSIASTIFAQGTTSRLVGTVTDSSGAAVPGASVTLTNENRGTKLTTVSASNGEYSFDLIGAGTYTVTVEKEGFKKYVSKNNVVNINQPTKVDAVIETGDITAVVTVEGSGEQVQTSTSGNVGTTITEQSIEALPIIGTRGRNPLDLLNFQPGISVGGNTGGGISVHGSRDRAFNFTLDGVDINESSAGGSNFTPLRPNPDSIQEFQLVTTNATAELGRSSGAQVTFVTRSGSNEFHGSVFDFYQTPGLNANSYRGNSRGEERAQFIQHIYGGSIGGPIYRDKAFFFANLQLLRARNQEPVTRTVYTQEARNGLFRYIQGGENAASIVDANGNTTLSNCTGAMEENCIASFDVATNPSGVGIDSTLLAVINQTPLPNDFSVGDGLNTAGFNFLSSRVEEQWDFVTRLDYIFSDTNSIYFRYAQGNQNTIGNGDPAFPGFPSGFDTRRDPLNWAVNHRWSPTDTITNELIVGYSTFTFNFANPEPTPSANFSFNLTSNPFSNFDRNARTLRTIQIADNIVFDFSPHTVRAGINFRFGEHFDDRSSVSGTSIEGLVNFSTGVNNDFSAFNLPVITDISDPLNPIIGIDADDESRLRSAINDLLGRVGTISQAFITSSDGSSFQAPGTRYNFTARYPELDFYIQDTWRIRPNLTFDIGLRYEAKFAPSSADSLPIISPDRLVRVGATPTDEIAWTPGEIFSDDLNNFAPSIGVAWDPNGDGKMSVRANYRLAYDRFPSFVFGSQIFQSSPGNNIGIDNSLFGQSGGLLRDGLPVLSPDVTPIEAGQPAPFGTGSIHVVDPALQYPEIHSWFVGFQYELWENNILEVNYIGKRGTHLFGGYDANQVNINAGDGTTTFLQEFNLIRADAAYNSPFINALFTGDPTDNSGTATFRSTNTTNIAVGNVASAANSVSNRTAGDGSQLIAANGFSPFLFRPFPQFSGALNVLDSNDLSRYNALEIIMKRRMTNGIQFQASYTYSVSRDTRSFDPTFSTVRTGTSQAASSTPFDNNNRKP